MSKENKKRILGKGTRPQFFNKLEINRDDVTLTIQFDDKENESIVSGEVGKPDVYVKFEDHYTGNSFGQKLYLLEFMMMLKQYIVQVKDFESCGGCKYMRLQPWNGPGEDGVGVVSYQEWPHCSLNDLKPIPPEKYNNYEIPDWCPCPDPKNRINEFMAMGLPVKDGSNPFEGGGQDGCSGCGSCGSCGGGNHGTLH